MSKVTGGYLSKLSCPFISNPPPTNVQWMKGSSPVQSGEEYQIFSHNGTLFISSLESAESELVSFTCYIANKYGSDNRRFNMHLIGEKMTLIVIIILIRDRYSRSSCKFYNHILWQWWSLHWAKLDSQQRYSEFQWWSWGLCTRTEP